MTSYLSRRSLKPWSALWDEEHPRVKLHWLVDTAELAVRWAVVVEPDAQWRD